MRWFTSFYFLTTNVFYAIVNPHTMVLEQYKNYGPHNKFMVVNRFLTKTKIKFRCSGICKNFQKDGSSFSFLPLKASSSSYSTNTALVPVFLRLSSSVSALHFYILLFLRAYHLLWLGCNYETQTCSLKNKIFLKSWVQSKEVTVDSTVHEFSSAIKH